MTENKPLSALFEQIPFFCLMKRRKKGENKHKGFIVCPPSIFKAYMDMNMKIL